MSKAVPYSDERWFVVFYQDKPTPVRFRKKKTADAEAAKIGGTVRRMGLDDYGNLLPMKRPEVITSKAEQGF